MFQGTVFAFNDAPPLPQPEKPLTPVGWGPVTPEPQVEVDRHVLSEKDYRQDPSILISNSRPAIASNIVYNSVNTQLPKTTIEKLNHRLKMMVKYDTTSKVIWKSKTPEEVIGTGRGNCFEVARLAMMDLTREGYKTHIVDVKTQNGKDWHSICVFQELDGTWSYFSATKEYIGYIDAHARNIQDLVKTQFRNVVDLKVVI